MDVTLNRTPVNVPADLATWGDLLDWLEIHYLKPGQCITHVHMGGSEAVNYRDRLICNNDIDAVGTIAVQSGDFDTVVRESLQELEVGLKSALRLSRDIVRLVEHGQEQDAYEQLGHLLDSVRVFFTIFSEDLGWSEVPNAELSRSEVSAALDNAVSQLAIAQETRYWVLICDVLEFEITPILEFWQKLAESTYVLID
jgi:hypothetical protein